MNEEMNLGEILEKEIKKRVLTEILLLIKESNNIEELEAKVKALLNK
ncbi:hypothetical protein [Peptostreptococcus porci]|nr:hypothetical protein [Peptostreptococcus porci]MDD7182667.1 hypothetical protein [Peptostreptococcus porci]MDY4128475.1 hypothetical protein [Peptostreptococcus porci]MDY5963675.1 hypothetical protein [Peptostreptococcus porci]